MVLVKESLLGVGSSILPIVVGIGLLRRKRWARVGGQVLAAIIIVVAITIWVGIEGYARVPILKYQKDFLPIARIEPFVKVPIVFDVVYVDA